jgi:hypothetical protein
MADFNWLCGLDDGDFDGVVDSQEPEDLKQTILVAEEKQKEPETSTVSAAETLSVSDKEPVCSLEQPDKYSQSPLQRLLLIDKAELPSYTDGTSFKMLADALRRRPLTAIQTNRFLRRLAIFRSPMSTGWCIQCIFNSPDPYNA